VPRSFEELEALPGVGHKTASVVMAQAFGVPAFPVDTHIHRLAARWGLSDGSKVERTEADLKALVPRERWIRTHVQLVLFGREHCPALRHDPAGCPICSWAAVAAPARARSGQSRAKPGAA
jgi:endonuclease III